LIEHPTALELEGFIFNTLPFERARLVVVHLIQGCESCRSLVTPCLEGFINNRVLSAQEDDAYDAALSRAFSAVQRRLLSEARAFIAGVPTEALARKLAEAPARIEGPLLVQALVERSQTQRYDNPAEMVRLAQLAANLAGELKLEGFDKKRVTDLRFLTLTELANAHRVADSLAAARVSINEALALFGQVSEDPLKARFFVVQADVFGAQRVYDSVIDTLNNTRVIYERHGEDHLAGRTLIKKALYLGYSGEPEEAIRLLHEGIAGVDEKREPTLVASAFQNLCQWLADSGRFSEARAALWEVRKRRHFLAGSVDDLKIHWLEGQISAGLDELESAEQHLLPAKRGFAAARLGYKEALTGVELGMVRLRMKRFDEAEQDILAALDVFEALSISYELKRAVLLLRLAIHEKVATVAFVERFVTFLRRKEYGQSSTF